MKNILLICTIFLSACAKQDGSGSSATTAGACSIYSTNGEWQYAGGDLSLKADCTGRISSPSCGYDFTYQYTGNNEAVMDVTSSTCAGISAGTRRYPNVYHYPNEATPRLRVIFPNGSGQYIGGTDYFPKN